MTSCLVCGTSLEGAEQIETPDRKSLAEGSFRVLVCPSCGGGTTVPIVPAEQLGAFYESEDEDYAPHETGGLMERLWAFAMSIRVRAARLFGPLRRAEPGAALDVGCGRGDLGVALRRRGWRVAGLDASPLACEAARARGIEAKQATIESLDADRAYDALVFHHSLEHVVDPVASLRAARRAVKPGGLIMIGVPNFGSRRAQRYRGDWGLLELPRHRFHFTPDALERAIEQAGLEQLQLRENAAVIGTAANIQQHLLGHVLESGPAFLAGYALNLAVFPFAWGLNEVRGGGELLNAVARRPAED